jgi:hypothetical protein
MSRFRKELLPPPKSFYEQELGKLSRPNRKGWAMANCPFHPSKSGKSFSVNLNSGGFHCFGCAAKGGDVLAFVRLRDRCDFSAACKTLGCWEDGKPARVPAELVRYITLDFDIDCDCYSASVKDEPRNYADKIRRFYLEARDRLIELGLDQTESREAEVCWKRMALALDELREIEMGIDGCKVTDGQR